MCNPDIGMTFAGKDDRRMIICHYCKQESSEAHALRVIYNHTTLHAEWAGWRMAGRWLVSPIGERIDASELLAMMRSRRTERLKAVSKKSVSTHPNHLYRNELQQQTKPMKRQRAMPPDLPQREARRPLEGTSPARVQTAKH